MSRSVVLVVAFGLLFGGVLADATPTRAQDPVRQTRSVASFTEVTFAVPGTLHVRQGAPRSVELEWPGDTLDRIETVVDDGRLEVRTPEASGVSGLLDWLLGGTEPDTAPIDVYVTMPTVEALSVAGAGTLVAETPIESEDLNLEVAGAGDIDAELSATRLDLTLAGAGGATLRGRADAANVECAGAGTVRAPDLQVATADVQTAGANTVELHVTDRLTAELAGAGSVRYHGQPTVEREISGAGSVRPITE
jgi:hypothetical protein